MAERATTVRLKVTDDFSVTIDRYSQKLGQAEANTKKLGQANQSVSDSLKSLDNKFNALFGTIAFGFGLNTVKNMAEGLYNIGQQTRRTELMFASFDDQIGNTEVMIQRLRAVSRGAATDLQLMSGANQLLNMGLVKSADQLQDYIEIAATFAQAQGTSMEDSLNQFAMIMTNQSYLRLDSLGIGAGAVRELATQYRAAGMSSSDAFNQAFLEVAQDKLPRMKEIADATVTDLQRLQVAADNWWSNFGERFATGVNTLIGIASRGGMLIQAALFGAESVQGGQVGAGNPAIVAAARAQAEAYTISQPDYAMQSTGHNAAVTEGMQSLLTSVLGYAQMVGVSPGDLTDAQMRQAGGFTGATSAERISEIRQWAQAAQTAIGTAVVWTRQSEDLGLSLQAANQAIASMPLLSGARAATPEEAQRGQLLGGMNSWLMSMQAQAGGAVTENGVQSMRQAADLMAEMKDDVLALAEANPELFSSQQLDMVKGMADEAGRLADNMQNTYDSIEKMSLSQALGQGDGGRLGEIQDMVYAQLEQMGLDPQSLANMRDMMDFQSGRQTAGSMGMDEAAALIARVATEIGPEAGLQAMMNLSNAITGQMQSHPGQPVVPNASWTGWMSTGTGTGSSFTAKPGDTVGALAAAAHMSVQDFASMYGISNPSMIVAGQTYSGGDAGGLMQIEQNVVDPMTEAQTMADTLATTLVQGVEDFSSALSQISRTPTDLRFRLLLDNVDQGLVQFLLNLIKANLGSLPGSSNFNGRSTAASGSFMAGGSQATAFP